MVNIIKITGYSKKCFVSVYFYVTHLLVAIYFFGNFQFEYIVKLILVINNLIVIILKLICIYQDH